MRTRASLVIVATCALLITGCGKGSADRAPSTSSTSTGTASTAPAAGGNQLRDEQLKAALLTAQEMPSGFTVDTDEHTGAPNDAKGCATLSGIQPSPGTAHSAQIEFTKGQTGTLVSESLLQQDEAQAKATLNQFATAASGCPTFKSGIISYTLSVLAFPKLGDDTLALHMAGTAAGVPVGIDLVEVRRGGVLMLVANAGVRTVDTALTESVARAALSKVDKTLG